MSKTVRVPTANPHQPNVTVHAELFAEYVKRLRIFGEERRPSHVYMQAGLTAYGDNGVVEMTPRGEDLLASLPYLPDDPEPETQPDSEPCEACTATGRRNLFVSTYECEACNGTGRVPRALHPPVAGPVTRLPYYAEGFVHDELARYDYAVPEFDRHYDLQQLLTREAPVDRLAAAVKKCSFVPAPLAPSEECGDRLEPVANTIWRRPFIPLASDFDD